MPLPRAALPSARWGSAPERSQRQNLQAARERQRVPRQQLARLPVLGLRPVREQQLVLGLRPVREQQLVLPPVRVPRHGVLRVQLEPEPRAQLQQELWARVQLAWARQELQARESPAALWV
jgi:hypothetical protein